MYGWRPEQNTSAIYVFIFELSFRGNTSNGFWRKSRSLWEKMKIYRFPPNEIFDMRGLLSLDPGKIIHRLHRASVKA